MVGFESVVQGYAMRLVLIAMFGMFAAAAAGPAAMVPGMLLGFVASVFMRL